MDFITFKHSFNSGDLITVLPGIRHICKKNNKKAIIYQRLDLPANYGHPWPHPVTSDNGVNVCMNRDMFDMLKPLIEHQDYIHEFKIWNGEEVVFDFDKTRQNTQMPLPGGSIHKWPSLIYPQLECSLEASWIDVDMPKKRKVLPGNDFVYDSGCISLTSGGWRDHICDETGCIGQILINRTERYTNPYISYHFLQKHANKIVFLGTKGECDSFCRQWGLGYDRGNCIYRLGVQNFYQLAQAIKSCKMFIGNQSFCWHIADALKVPRILEVCTQYPNTFPTGNNGYSFITQEALEFRFHKLLNEE